MPEPPNFSFSFARWRRTLSRIMGDVRQTPTGIQREVILSRGGNQPYSYGNSAGSRRDARETGHLHVLSDSHDDGRFEALSMN